jgi:hypothetical protein
MSALAGFLVGLALGLFSAHRANKRLAADLKHEQATIRSLGRELHHASKSLAHKDDEIDLLNARLLEANAELVVLRGDDDLPPEAA